MRPRDSKQVTQLICNAGWDPFFECHTFCSVSCCLHPGYWPILGTTWHHFWDYKSWISVKVSLLLAWLLHVNLIKCRQSTWNKTNTKCPVSWVNIMMANEVVQEMMVEFGLVAQWWVLVCHVTSLGVIPSAEKPDRTDINHDWVPKMATVDRDRQIDKCACSLTSGVFSMLEPLRYSANYHTGPWDVSSSDRRVLQRRPLSSYQCWSAKRGNRQKRGLAIFIPSPGEAFSKKGVGLSFQTEKKPGKPGK